MNTPEFDFQFGKSVRLKGRGPIGLAAFFVLIAGVVTTTYSDVAKRIDSSSIGRVAWSSERLASLCLDLETRIRRPTNPSL